MNQIRSMAQFNDMIQQVLDELDDLRAVIEYDEEFMDGAMAMLEPLEREVQGLNAQIQMGDYQFGGEELACMPMVNSTDARLLPFKQLLLWINEVHCQGLPDE